QRLARLGHGRGGHRRRPPLLPRHGAARARRGEAGPGLTRAHHPAPSITERNTMRHSTRRGFLLASAMAASAAIALAGCSTAAPEPEETFEPITSIKLQLQWLPQAQFAGYFAALD